MRCKHGNARTIWWLTTDLASSWWLARVPNEALQETIDNLARLFMVAGWIERVEFPDA
jgi:hypothetical protein